MDDDLSDSDELTDVEEGIDVPVESEPPTTEKQTRYNAIMEHIFSITLGKGDPDMPFERAELEAACKLLNISVPKNLGDIVYNARYRYGLPPTVLAAAPEGREWVILPAGRGKYRFRDVQQATFTPAPARAVTKIPDSTPGPIAKYAMLGEQALLAKLRYNRLIDIFTGVVCYSLQNHLKTTVQGMGQVETDELYVGIDRHGAHYAIPVQAKGGEDKINVVQIYQDFGLCREKFRGVIARPIGAQFMRNDTIALLEFAEEGEEIVLLREAHYQLVPVDQVTLEELVRYGQRIRDSDLQE